MKVPGDTFPFCRALMNEQAVSARNEGHPQCIQTPGNHYDQTGQQGLEPYCLIKRRSYLECEAGRCGTGDAILVGSQSLKVVSTWREMSVEGLAACADVLPGIIYAQKAITKAHALGHG